MDDFAERLRKYNREGQVQYEWFDEAADYIEALEEKLKISTQALTKIAHSDTQAWAIYALRELENNDE